MISRIIVANKFVGYLNIKNKNKHTCVHGLILGVRPEGVTTPLPFLLPIGVELFLDASSAPSAVLTVFSLDSSFLESFFPACSSRDLAAGDLDDFDDDFDDDPDLSTEDLLD